MTAQPFADIAPWPPTRHTPPLAPDFKSAFDPYARAFAIIWACAFGYALEPWQIHLIRAILEVFPEGHERAGQLRWQQAVVSLGRQNGKTEIAAALGLWRLLRSRRALVIGIASSAEQAGLVYRRTMDAVAANPELSELFHRLTDTRGIRTKSGGRYEIKAAKSAALQGLPIDLGLVDELHILRRALWGDLVSGTGARPDCLVVGITTAGDASSELLIDLYKLGAEAIADGGVNRVGFWVWEAPEARIPDDDATLKRWLAMANPAVASGRTDLAALVSIVRSKSKPDVIRYHLNQFLSSVTAPFIDAEDWHAARRSDGEAFPSSPPVVAIDATPGWTYATFALIARDEGGRIHERLVASLVRPTFEQLRTIALDLARLSPVAFAMDSYTLRKLGRTIGEYGYPVHIGTLADATNAAALLHGLIRAGRFRHSGEPLLSAQVPRAVRKTAGDGFRISRADSATHVDALNAIALGALVLDQTPDAIGIQVG
ncbi:terminase large subunit domain-containing protein [Microbacterium dextranolyticum]|uniref:Terminase large subunit-like ATPase domain-containing protein n=1 Tax=Microbacterium dextranolyticum TaxID=36806 RepID=A0A9W6HML5_9MICO|nr:terminase large subunit [Microbacterium dextranolyticum]MBM7462918.1 phage terminase large subunit-like protein [Microbacterium dextranolyticum]GLJ95977.1 hypothetical protein GCM10017591_20400 [Microbacterium dextranolyticum]